MSRESSDKDGGDRVFRKRGSLGTISDGWKCPTVGSRSIRRRRRMIHRNAVSSLIYINATYECVKNGRRLGEKQLLCQTIGARRTDGTGELRWESGRGRWRADVWLGPRRAGKKGGDCWVLVIGTQPEKMMSGSQSSGHTNTPITHTQKALG